MEWVWTLNIGHWFDYIQGGDYAEALYYVKILPWFAWPALPLAAWAVWEARRRVLHEAEFQLLLVSFFVMLLTLSVVPNIKEVFALPILLPLTLLANCSPSHPAPGSSQRARLVRHHDVRFCRHLDVVGLGWAVTG